MALEEGRHGKHMKLLMVFLFAYLRGAGSAIELVQTARFAPVPLQTTWLEAVHTGSVLTRILWVESCEIPGSSLWYTLNCLVWDGSARQFSATWVCNIVLLTASQLL